MLRVMCVIRYLTIPALRSHRQRQGKFGTCREQFEKKRALNIISQFDPQDIVDAAEKKQKLDNANDLFQMSISIKVKKLRN